MELIDKPGRIRAAPLPDDALWLNVERPLRLPDLEGRLVLVDFWTSGCVNCAHMVPVLRRMQERFGAALALVGVHSAKFDAEGEPEALRKAVSRLGVRHPVVSDPERLVFRTWGARAWPSLFLLDASGRLAGRHFGEIDGAALGGIVEHLLRESRNDGALRPGPLPVAPGRVSGTAVPGGPEEGGPPGGATPSLELGRATALSFPGKVLAGADHLFVADTGHHRVLAAGVPRVGGRETPVLACIGGREPGFEDGDFETARFREPRGMARRGNALFVADSGNHALRRVDLEHGRVDTVAGTGDPARPGAGGGVGPDAPLCSPWDLAVDGDGLYVAMAGLHQVWRYDLDWGEIVPWAGSGREGLEDGPRSEAALAQPGGLAVDGRTLWIADSESSSVRRVALDDDGAVETAVGRGLLVFGDRDGDRETALLQHPLDVAVAGGVVWVADTYNHKVRRLVSSRGRLESGAGDGTPGRRDDEPARARFDGPEGLSVAGGWLWIADTGSHALRRLPLDGGPAQTVELTGVPSR